MKTDRELLELAAKAAGIPVVACTCSNPKFPLAHDTAKSGKYGHWSPLAIDGDALRLAMKLRLRVCTPTTDTDCALASNGDVTAYSEDELSDTPMSDLYAATRRAIVRAAAAIGEAMQ